MRHYILIHGSWHGAWCWYKIAPRLEAAGHSVSVPDLPGRGRSPARPAMVGLDRIVKSLEPLLAKDRKTTVVVHSRYGIVASRLAELFPDRIERTIYLASFMIPAGQAVVDYFRADTGSLLRPGFELNRLGMWDWLKPEVYHEGLYHDCDEDDNKLAHMLLCKEPFRPVLTKLKLTENRYGQVPRSYIRLTDDRAVTPWLQDKVLNETKVDRVESMAAGHSAYFSKPDELTDCILKLSQT
ncbi:MAG: alpha/beta fold hydrolase [Methyloligellaceae bacterium]